MLKEDSCLDNKYITEKDTCKTHSSLQSDYYKRIIENWFYYFESKNLQFFYL